MHGVTRLPLHGGKAPRWLFGRMVKLSRAISEVIIDEYGADELLARLTDPNWFQALACAIGYDWHSSGTTTVTMGAIKEAMNDSGEIFIAGGKGKTGLKTPQEIIQGADLMVMSSRAEPFAEYSRLSAKIDGSMVYDDLGIYHHTFLFTKNGKWGVVQQGMSRSSNTAVRFQWNSTLLNEKDITDEPHASVSSELRRLTVDLTHRDNGWAREASVEALSDYPRIVRELEYPARHRIDLRADIGRKGLELIRRASDVSPENYRELLMIRGVGRATLRSLAFVSSLIYDKELAQRDPVAFAYNLGGKDRIPFEINSGTYDSVIAAMDEIIDRADMSKEERYSALRRLGNQRLLAHQREDEEKNAGTENRTREGHF